MMKKKRRDYSKIKYDDLPKVLEPGERKVIKSDFKINHSEFKHSEKEKLQLKAAKSQYKHDLALKRPPR